MPHIITAYGNAQLDTAQKKFGTASGLFDGDGDYLSIPDSADWNFGAGDWTIDLWAKFAVEVADYAFYWQQYNSSNRIFIEYQGSAPNYGRVRFYAISDGVVVADFYTPAWSPGTANWHHIELVRSGNTAYIFFDGVSQSLTLVETISGKTLPDIDAVLWIGQGIGSPMNGWLDEFRVSKGVARHTADFTPPVAAYSRDDDTVLLMHMDGVDGSTTFTDDGYSQIKKISGVDYGSVKEVLGVPIASAKKVAGVA